MAAESSVSQEDCDSWPVAARGLATPSELMTMVHETYVKEAEGFSRRRFIASEGGLKVDLPSDPTELKTTLRTGVGPVKVHGFRSKHDGVVYLAAYSECHARLDMLEYLRRRDAPLDLWIPGEGRRRSLGSVS